MTRNNTNPICIYYMFYIHRLFGCGETRPLPYYGRTDARNGF